MVATKWWTSWPEGGFMQMARTKNLHRNSNVLHRNSSGGINKNIIIYYLIKDEDDGLLLPPNAYSQCCPLSWVLSASCHPLPPLSLFFLSCMLCLIVVLFFVVIVDMINVIVVVILFCPLLMLSIIRCHYYRHPPSPVHYLVVVFFAINHCPSSSHHLPLVHVFIVFPTVQMLLLSHLAPLSPLTIDCCIFCFRGINPCHIQPQEGLHPWQVRAMCNMQWLWGGRRCADVCSLPWPTSQVPKIDL